MQSKLSRIGSIDTKERESSNQGGGVGRGRDGSTVKKAEKESCYIFEYYIYLKEGLYEVRNALLNPHLTLKFRKTNFTKMNDRKISR